MTRKTLLLYTAVWKKILNLAHKLKENLIEIMSDFETAIQKSITNSISKEITVKACWFHFCQALLRYWKKLGLIRKKAPKTVLWMVMNLALAPDTRFSEGLELIEKVCKDDIQNFKDIKTFLDYVKNQWIPLASVLCVCDCSQRTNNAVESFHKNAFDELGGNHPHMYAFLTKMAAYIASEDLQYLRVLKGYSIRRRESKTSITNDAHILYCQKELIDKKIDLEEFLKTVVTREHQNQLKDLLEITGMR
ncbi:uncharacterized protein LOC122504814 [Leptopilina heterotoma]|uniref:uncharacterized protein LOC122501879 n=1 Tax=Leptopilina heterotoma TaxID=63436 RepID=UPI001CA80537|nr:uncharacterized protein LOC122501879 [Leptopilina heterotoma]XP_043472010.1 uncharacterized protein LOC122504814 [Leptopilina heterotoma]